MRERVLLTGIAGFVGSHLAELLVRRDAEVHGMVRSDTAPNLDTVRENITLHRADLRDRQQTASAVREARPDVVIHLAAQAVPSVSWRDPRGTVETNVLGTVELLEAVRQLGSTPLVILASTAEVYADAVEQRLPLREDYPLGPRTPYAASKVAQEMLLNSYTRAGAIRGVILRCANQVGPRLSPELVASAFARQIAEAEAGGTRAVRVGNLAPRRDFVDVRDVANAYVLALERGEPGAVYNVGTGTAVPVSTVLDLLMAASRVPLTVEKDPERMQRHDRAAIALDASTFRERTGWRPVIPLQQSLRDTLEHWRAVVARTAPTRRMS